MSPRLPCRRLVLYQSTHSATAISTSSMHFHGPLSARMCRLRISSALKVEFYASAAALSYESPFVPTEATASTSARRSV